MTARLSSLLHSVASLGARMPPHQAWLSARLPGCHPRDGPSPRPPHTSPLLRACAPGISQALEGTPALEASPQRQHTSCVSCSM